MQSVKELTDIVGLSTHQIRSRVKALDDEFEDVTRRGKQNKIMVTDNGLALLRRLKELEDSGSTIDSGIQQMREEQEPEVEEDTETINEDRLAEIRRLEQRVEELEEDKEYLQERLERRDDQLDRLLPGQTQGGLLNWFRDLL